MKYYDLNGFTVGDLKEMIRKGDDRHDNQIRVTFNGRIYLSQDIVGADKTDGLLFRLETFDAGNDYVGENAAADAKLIDQLYRTIMKRWEQGARGLSYIDIWEQ